MKGFVQGPETNNTTYQFPARDRMTHQENYQGNIG